MFLDFSRELKIWVYWAKVKLFYKMVEFGILPEFGRGVKLNIRILSVK